MPLFAIAGIKNCDSFFHVHPSYHKSSFLGIIGRRRLSGRWRTAPSAGGLQVSNHRITTGATSARRVQGGFRCVPIVLRCVASNSYECMLRFFFNNACSVFAMLAGCRPYCSFFGLFSIFEFRLFFSPLLLLTMGLSILLS